MISERLLKITSKTT